MRVLLLLSVVLLLAIPIAADACRVPLTEKQRAEDLVLERRLVAEASEAATQIMLATARTVSAGDQRAEFEVIENLKGTRTGAFVAHWTGARVDIGCRPSDVFWRIELEPGESYLLYLNGDEVVRAANTGPRRWGMSIEDELSQVGGTASP